MDILLRQGNENSPFQCEYLDKSLLNSDYRRLTFSSAFSDQSVNPVETRFFLLNVHSNSIKFLYNLNKLYQLKPFCSILKKMLTFNYASDIDA